MLRRIQGVRQDDAAKQRAWFQDEFFDLFVWTEASGAVTAFQLCYDRQGDERVLAWSDASGFLHRRIDSGEQSPAKNMTPILVMDGHFAAGRVGGEFAARSSDLDPRVREFLLGKIRQAGSELPLPAAH